MSSVLIVDDDEDLAALFDLALTRRGFAVTVARSCKQAQELLARTSFDVLVTDLSLPDGNGAQLVTSLAMRPRCVVVVSGYSASTAQAHDARACADVYISKPVDIDDLAQRVSAILAR